MDTDSISKGIMTLIINHIDAQKSDRGVAKKAGISNTSIDLYRGGASMKLDTMEKILDAYPELREPVARVLLGEAGEKHTAATNSNDAAVNATITKLSDSIDRLTRANLIANETISQLVSGKMVKE